MVGNQKFQQTHLYPSPYAPGHFSTWLQEPGSNNQPLYWETRTLPQPATTTSLLYFIHQHLCSAKTQFQCVYFKHPDGSWADSLFKLTIPPGPHIFLTEVKRAEKWNNVSSREVKCNPGQKFDLVFFFYTSFMEQHAAALCPLFFCLHSKIDCRNKMFTSAPWDGNVSYLKKKSFLF